MPCWRPWSNAAVPDVHYQSPGTWFGDCMPIHARGAFYLFHQRDTRNPGPFGEPFGWSLARTTDFVTYEDLGDPLERGSDDAQDQFIFAGSVYEWNDTYYALYTGYNRHFSGTDRPSQVLMVATSTDLETWSRTDRVLVSPEPGYDPDNWRDPYVLWDEENQRHVMILGARTVENGKLLTGRTVWFTSRDLETWQFEGDFWAPGLYTMHEMPDLFRLGDHWYLLTTEYSDKSKTVYRTSTSLTGPWSAPADDAFDGRAYYAARSASDGERRYMFGWVATKENEDDRGEWQWGGTLLVHEVYARADASLGVRIPPAIAESFDQQRTLVPGPIELSGRTGLDEVTVGTDGNDPFLWETTLRFTEGTRGFAVRVFEDPASGDGYAFYADVAERRLRFDRRPNYPWNRYASKGLERPLDLEPGVEHHVRVLADDTIVTVYIEGVALSVRTYAKAGRSLAVQVVDGTLTVSASTLARRGAEDRLVDGPAAH